jgi:hypothetical protein
MGPAKVNGAHNYERKGARRAPFSVVSILLYSWPQTLNPYASAS